MDVNVYGKNLKCVSLGKKYWVKKKKNKTSENNSIMLFSEKSVAMLHKLPQEKIEARAMTQFCLQAEMNFMKQPLVSATDKSAKNLQTPLQL